MDGFAGKSLANASHHPRPGLIALVGQQDPLFLPDQAVDLMVAVLQRLRGVDHEDHGIGLGDLIQAAAHALVFDIVAVAVANAGHVGDLERQTVQMQFFLDVIAGGAGQWEMIDRSFISRALNREDFPTLTLPAMTTCMPWSRTSLKRL